MKLGRAILSLTLAATGIVASTSLASADPQTAPPAHVTYRAELIGTSVVTTLGNGTFTSSGTGSPAALRNTAGDPVDFVPSAYRLDGQLLRLRHTISGDGRTLTVTPDITGLDRAALRRVASPLENQLAMNDLVNAVSISTSLGALVGTAVGAIAGIGVGIVLSGAACVAVSVGCVVAVLPIMTLAATAGGIAGLIIAGGPTIAAAAFEYITTLNAPAGTSKYAEYADGPAAGTPQ